MSLLLIEIVCIAVNGEESFIMMVSIIILQLLMIVKTLLSLIETNLRSADHLGLIDFGGHIKMVYASFIFTMLGMIVNFFYLPLSYSLLSLLFGVITLISLAGGEKHVWIGIVNIIFVSVLGGIFYLCRNNDDKNEEKK